MEHESRLKFLDYLDLELKQKHRRSIDSIDIVCNFEGEYRHRFHQNKKDQLNANCRLNYKFNHFSRK